MGNRKGDKGRVEKIVRAFPFLRQATVVAYLGAGCNLRAVGIQTLKEHGSHTYPTRIQVEPVSQP
jgi:hypothetical protein